MTITDSFLEKGWGDSVDSPTMRDVKEAIRETKRMDDEHGAFWLGIFDTDNNEIVLETTKSMLVTLLINPDKNPPIKKLANNWRIIRKQYQNMLNGDIHEVERWMKDV